MVARSRALAGASLVRFRRLRRCRCLPHGEDAGQTPIPFSHLTMLFAPFDTCRFSQPRVRVNLLSRSASNTTPYGTFTSAPTIPQELVSTKMFAVPCSNQTCFSKEVAVFVCVCACLGLKREAQEKKSEKDKGEEQKSGTKEKVQKRKRNDAAG